MAVEENCETKEEYISLPGGSLYQRRKKSPLNIFLNVIIVFFLAVLLLELLFNAFFTGIYVIDESMRPTLNGASSVNVSGGDFIYVDKYASPARGDIVVVYREYENDYGKTEGGNIIKRVIAFGGEEVKIISGVVYVNGQPLSEDYIAPSMNDRVDDFGAHTVKEGCLFLLGDNRNVSLDSRQNGDYPVKNLVGVVPQWSLNIKSFTTGMYTFFKFTLSGKK